MNTNLPSISAEIVSRIRSSMADSAINQATVVQNLMAEATLAEIEPSVLLADLARCLVWMEHVNRVAEREEKLGGWLSNHTENLQGLDLEYHAIRKQITKT